VTSPDATAATAAARRRAVSGFTLYDVANSAFVTTVVTAVGGPFLTAVAEAAAGDDGRSDSAPSSGSRSTCSTTDRLMA